MLIFSKINFVINGGLFDNGQSIVRLRTESGNTIVVSGFHQFQQGYLWWHPQSAKVAQKAESAVDVKVL